MTTLQSFRIACELIVSIDPMTLRVVSGNAPTDEDTQAQIKARAEQLAATIDPSTILVEDSDDGVVRFGQFVEEAARAGVKPGAAKGATKRRARR